MEIFRWIPDYIWLKWMFYLKNGHSLNLQNPQTFSEKMQWLKIYGFKPEYTNMVDKYAVKAYVAEKIGKEYVIPTIQIWETVDDIDWTILPRQYVLKMTHGGGNEGVVVVHDSDKINKQWVTDCLRRSMHVTGIPAREHVYDGVIPRVIAERLLIDYSHPNDDLIDYKFYCFNGEPMYCQVIRNRSTKETIDFYDMEWNHMPFVGLNPVARHGEIPVARPTHLDKMQEICRVLSAEIPFLRVDLYEIEEASGMRHVYFGELTFYPASGFGEFSPKEWNQKLGDMLHLPI